MNYVIDSMQPADSEQTLAIYAEGIATGQATFETKLPSWRQWDDGHLPVCRLVARHEGKILGWAALSAVSRRQVYAGVAEVSIYIAADARGQGVGSALMAALIGDSEAHDFWTLQSSVFAENLASIKLHLNHGFRELGRRERIAQLHGVWRDTVLLERRSSRVGVD